MYYEVINPDSKGYYSHCTESLEDAISVYEDWARLHRGREIFLVQHTENDVKYIKEKVF